MKTYKVIKVTELDRVTPKQALPKQNFDYNKEFATNNENLTNEPHVGRSMFITIGDKDGVIRTSTVQSIDIDDEQLLVVETRNTVYFLEELNDKSSN